MSDSDLNINCWILGNSSDEVFSVKISRGENVDALKVAINLREGNTLPAKSLILYKVSIPYSPQLAEDAAALGPNRLKLKPLDVLSEVFANELDRKHVHVIVEIPFGTWVYIVLSSLR